MVQVNSIFFLNYKLLTPKVWPKPGAEETSHQLVVGIVIKMHPPIIKKSKKQFSPGLGQSTEPVRIV